MKLNFLFKVDMIEKQCFFIYKKMKIIFFVFKKNFYFIKDSGENTEEFEQKFKEE